MNAPAEVIISRTDVAEVYAPLRTLLMKMMWRLDMTNPQDVNSVLDVLRVGGEELAERHRARQVELAEIRERSAIREATRPRLGALLTKSLPVIRDDEPAAPPAGATPPAPTHGEATEPRS